MIRYKLYYFNARGRAEIIRMIFAVAGQEFDDIRVDFADWPSIKPQAPLGQVPFIEMIDDVTKQSTKMGQSITIARFLAKRFGLAGRDEFEQAFADMYADQVTDLLNEFVKVHFEKCETRKKEMCEKLHTDILITNMRLFESRLSSNNGYLSGDSLTYADVIYILSLSLFFLPGSNFNVFSFQSSICIVLSSGWPKRISQ